MRTTVIQDPQQQLQLILARLELAILLLIGTFQTLFHNSIEKLVAPPDVLLSDFGLLMLALLAFVPVARFSPIKKMSITVLQISIAGIAAPFGVPGFFDVLYMLYIARAGAMLDGRFVILPLATAIIVHVLSKELRYVLTERYIYALTPLQHIVHLLVVGRVVNFSLLLTLSAFCTHAVISERKLRFEREQLNARLEEVSKEVERLRIAREIHDSAGHIMTSMCMHIDVAEALIIKKREKALQSILTANSLVQQLAQEFQLLSLEVDQLHLNLGESLRDLLSRHEKESQFNLHVELSTPCAMKPAATGDFVNIVKEGLHNITKYANAADVWFSVREEAGKIYAELKDNGTGFDPSTVRSSSFGLKGMKERAQTHGGTVEVESSVGAGTVLKIVFPAD